MKKSTKSGSATYEDLRLLWLCYWSMPTIEGKRDLKEIILKYTDELGYNLFARRHIKKL